MTKADCIKKAAEKAGLTQTDTKKAIDAFFDVVVELMKNDDSLTYTGFGTFKSNISKERIGTNPKTGEKITIKSKKQPKFSFSDTVKNALNE